MLVLFILSFEIVSLSTKVFNCFHLNVPFCQVIKLLLEVMTSFVR